MSERTTVRLPAELVLRAKRKAAAEGRSLTALVEEGLRRVVSERTSVEKIWDDPLPVSTAVGGTMPGVDLNDSAALHEMDDILDFRRGE
jgi:hypothetical protein